MKKLNKKPGLILLILLTLLLSSCSGLSASNRSAVSTPNPLLFLHDELFLSADAAVIETELFLDLPDNYKRELDSVVLSLETEYERYRALRAWVYRHFEDYEFDTTETYSLSELNTNRKINCLSFSAIFVAAARYADIPADFQLVFAPPYWDEENGTWINNQHIDVTGLIERTEFRSSQKGNGFFSASARWTRSWEYDGSSTLSRLVGSNSYRYVVDINPAIVSMPLKRQKISDQQVLSLYYSNKSMEFLLNQDMGQAYAYTREALITDPTSTAAWNNLGVLYSRIGQLDHASRVFLMAIEVDENAYSARSNLASVYQRQGKAELAATMTASVEEFRKENPYYHQSLAQEKLNGGDYEQAIVHLEDAVARKHNELHFYHELAIAHQQLGNDEEVIENLTSARRHARGAERIRFSGKLKALQELIEARQADI